TAVLSLQRSLTPSRVYPPGDPDLALWPQRYRDDAFPMQVLTVEGHPKLAEFWGSMGTGSRWRPVIQLSVTLPRALVREVAGPMVTTMFTRYRIAGRPETDELWLHIGVQVGD